MTNEELNAIKARVEKATPGPWVLVNRDSTGADNPYLGYDVEPLEQSWLDRGMFANRGDADFIAHAREDISALIAEIELLRLSHVHPCPVGWERETIQPVIKLETGPGTVVWTAGPKGGRTESS